jgi:hypothetical protein
MITRLMRKLLLCTLLITLPAVAAPKRRPSSPPASFPQCSMITGSPAVTFTRNEGASLTRTALALTGIGYTYGLTAVDENTLVAVHKSDLLISNDAGCTWNVVTQLDGPEFPPRVAAGSDGRIYAWSDNRQWTVRYDDRGAFRLKQPVHFVGFAVDPLNPDHIRGGGHDGSSANGSIWDSRDGGETWEHVAPVPRGALIYRFVFDPQNLDHVVLGTLTQGSFVSFDGGRTWTPSEGIRGSRGTNVFEFAVSPVDTNVIWAMGIDMAESDAGVPSHGRHIYRSTNGGLTFTPVLDEEPGVKLINGPTMAAHPTNPDVLYFVFGTHVMNYGTDLFRYDASSDELTMTHNDHHGINAITFSPKDPRVMYLGLEVVGGGGF